jgi:hypothetical protein
MELSCAKIKDFVKEFSLVHQCDVVQNGMLRIATPFYYPNGSQIDLFLESTPDALFPQLELSDYGQTADYLLDMQLKPWSTKNRRRLITDICEALEVKQQSGRFYIPLNFEELNNHFSSSIVKLAQACIRVADLSFTQRLQMAGTFQENIEEFISNADLQYEPDVELVGKFGNSVRVDFQVRGQTITSLIQTLSTPTPTNAHSKSVEVFTRWYDLLEHRANNQFVTVFDTTTTVYKEYDFKRLQELSTVLGFPEEQEEIFQAIAA